MLLSGDSGKTGAVSHHCCCHSAASQATFAWRRVVICTTVYSVHTTRSWTNSRAGVDGNAQRREQDDEDSEAERDEEREAACWTKAGSIDRPGWIAGA